MSAPITLVGRLAADPELKTSNSGSAYCRLKIVTERREWNKQSSQWTSTEVTFWDCTAFGATAKNTVTSLTKGMLVIATGRVSQEEWTDKSGAKRTSLKVVIDEIGPSLRFAEAHITSAHGTATSSPQRHAAPQQPAARQYDDVPF